MARTDHCWTDVVDPSELEIYSDFFKRSERVVGDRPALLAIEGLAKDGIYRDFAHQLAVLSRQLVLELRRRMALCQP